MEEARLVTTESKRHIDPYSDEAETILMAKREKRKAEYRESTAAQLDMLGTAIKDMGAALAADDDIWGVLASSAVADILPRLPANVRESFRDALSDEAAASARADDAYETARYG